MTTREDLIYIISAIHRQKVLDHKFPEWPDGVEIRAMAFSQHIDSKLIVEELDKAVNDGSVKKLQTVNGFIYSFKD